MRTRYAVTADGVRKFTVPLETFGGTFKVTIKMAAVNANDQRGADASTVLVTVGPVNQPTGVTATPAVGSGNATVAVEWLPGDATSNKFDIKAYSDKGAVMTFSAAGADNNAGELRKALVVGGGMGQLLPGHWRFAVVAENANSQAESLMTSSSVPAGIPGAPSVMAVTPTPGSNDATIAFTLASDELADHVRASYAAVASSTWETLLAVAIPTTEGATKQITITTLPTGIWRFRLEAGNAATGAWSPPSNVWPAQTFGLPGQPSIMVGSATGSKDTISLVVQQAEDATATSFVLGVFDFEGNAVPTYSAPLLSVGTLDTQTKQQRVVFGTDQSKTGGRYRFTVTAINSVGPSAAASAMTIKADAVAAYMPATPTGLVAVGGTNKATLSFTAPAGAVSYQAMILAAGNWQVPSTTSLAPYAPGTVQLVDDETVFDVPLSALAYRDGDYSFKVRAVDANGVPGDWSTASSGVTVGAPDSPSGLAITSKPDLSAVDLSFVPAWLAEQGYEIEVLDKDGQPLDLVTIPPASLTACPKAPAPQ